jgi:ferredoxin
MGGLEPGNGARGGGVGRGQGTSRGMRRRRRDGSRRRVRLSPPAGAIITDRATAALIDSTSAASGSANAPAVASGAHTVAVVARPGSCTACGTCVEACLQDAITLGDTAVIDASICTGCGLCVSDCANGALAFAEV